jgi:uncharacterized protein
MKKTVNLCIILIILLLGIISLKNKIASENVFCEMYIFNNQNIKITIKAEIADTSEKKSKGLMFRKNLAKNTGMLFVFNREEILNFWMKNTHIPLSIAYINKSGFINEIYSMKPLDTSITYPSKKPCTYALEVNKDWFKANNISEGCKIVFNACLSK